MADQLRRHVAHFAVLDGFRGVAAIAVWYQHAVAPIAFFPHSYLAVDFFFVLSGFVIARAYGSRLESGTLGFAEFTAIRLVRLFPMLFFGTVVGFTLLLLRIHFNHDTYLLWPGIKTFALNLFVLPSFYVMRTGANGLETPWPFDLPTWSLFFELIANFVYAVVALRMTPRVRLIALFVFAGCHLTTYLMTPEAADLNSLWLTWQNWASCFAHVAFSFTAGLVLYDLYRDHGPLPRVSLWLPLSVLLACFFSRGQVSAEIITLLILPPLVFLGASAVASGPIERICLWLGAISYPLYLIHWPFLKILRRAIDRFHPTDSQNSVDNGRRNGLCDVFRSDRESLLRHSGSQSFDAPIISRKDHATGSDAT